MESALPVLTVGQYQLAYNALSFAVASMVAGAFFFILARPYVGERYRSSLLISAIVVIIAAYHYFRIFNSWSAAYAFEGGVYMPTGEPFNDLYRYIDWLLTVPLLLTETVAVLALPRGKSGSLIARLAFAAVLMIALGYPGEILDPQDQFWARFGWGFLSSVPFAYILYVLWVELGQQLEQESQQVRKLVRNLRLLLLGTWGVYPIAYMIPMFGLGGAWAEVGLQLGYTLADVLAKPAFGLLIYAIAREKTREDEGEVGVGSEEGSQASAAATD